jgi:1-acyl-sn-glycerol-3-phosphate acyltransferase
MRGIVQALRTPLVASAFFFFWGGAVLLSWLVCPVLLLVVPDRVRRRRICQRIGRHAYRIFHGYMHLLRLVDMGVAGPYRERPAGPLVMISNHPTLVDATAILANYDEVCCVVKTSLIRNFFVGRFLRYCGHIDGGNGEVMSGAATIQQARARLADGDAVLIFPEGGRSPRRGMRGFRRGAFELATREQVPLWPIFISCDPPALSKGVPIWRHPDTAARQLLTPQPLVHPSGENSSRTLCRRVQATCLAWLEERDLVDRSTDPPPVALNVDAPRSSSYKFPAMPMELREEQADDPR